MHMADVPLMPSTLQSVCSTNIARTLYRICLLSLAAIYFEEWRKLSHLHRKAMKNVGDHRRSTERSSTSFLLSPSSTRQWAIWIDFCLMFEFNFEKQIVSSAEWVLVKVSTALDVVVVSLYYVQHQRPTIMIILFWLRVAREFDGDEMKCFRLCDYRWKWKCAISVELNADVVCEIHSIECHLMSEWVCVCVCVSFATQKEWFWVFPLCWMIYEFVHLLWTSRRILTRILTYTTVWLRHIQFQSRNEEYCLLNDSQENKHSRLIDAQFMFSINIETVDLGSISINGMNEN